MNKDFLRAARNKSVEWLWTFEQARTKLNILQTVVVVLTFVKVWGLTDLEIAIVTCTFMAGVFAMGLIMDKTKFTHRYIEENQRRSAVFMKTFNNTEEILKKLESGK